MSFGAAYAASPAEVLDLGTLEQTGRLLAGFLGAEWKNTAVSRTSGATSSSQPNAAAALAWPLAPLIEQLVEAYGVSRSEAPVRNLIQAAFPPWAARRSSVDERGNLIVKLGRKGEPKALFIAHVDEIGFEVERIERTGRAATKPSGGILEELFTSRPVVVLGARGPLDAVMTNSGEIDIGAVSREEAEAAGVTSGVTVATPKHYRWLFGSRISARSLDDRVGCAVLLAALRERGGVAERWLDRGEPVWIMFSVEEELGMLGSASTAQQVRPQRVYPVDSFVTSDSPLEDRRRAYARLGDGFVLRALDDSGATPRPWVEYVAELARKHQIPIQYGVTAGGNDGSRFVEFGAVNIPLSWPLRYAHTAAEVADMSDAEALRKIVAVLLEQELAGKMSDAVQ
jgi:putative aminopeptidase FrvX